MVGCWFFLGFPLCIYLLFNAERSNFEDAYEDRDKFGMICSGMAIAGWFCLILAIELFLIHVLKLADYSDEYPLDIFALDATLLLLVSTVILRKIKGLQVRIKAFLEKRRATRRNTALFNRRKKR